MTNKKDEKHKSDAAKAEAKEPEKKEAAPKAKEVTPLPTDKLYAEILDETGLFTVIRADLTSIEKHGRKKPVPAIQITVGTDGALDVEQAAILSDALQEFIKDVEKS